MFNSLGIPEHFISNNPRSYWTQNYILRAMKIELIQVNIGRERDIGVAVHTVHHSPIPLQLGAFINTFSSCGITLSLGKKVNFQLVNRMAAIAQRSASRVHIHTGSVVNPVWNKKADSYYRMRNTFRSPHIILSKVQGNFTFVTCHVLFYHNFNRIK